ncbi:MAG: aminotransferase class V-fold PLP-dependent enzyme [Deltaproteobacteria bacterium]|nr:aminotransferase class V-fold PLP-dependent enzyme [Deltaproteobacteria bacterium]
MIYLDNAATSYPKPESVYQRIDHILRHTGGNPGRSGHRMALDASRVIFEARESAARLFNIKNASRIVFTKNATEAINIAFKGILRQEEHVVTTSIEHNAVVKPLKRLEARGVQVTQLKVDKNGWVEPKDIEKAIRKETKLISVVHASNVFGAILPVAEIGRICRKKNVLFMVDAAQTAGAMPIDIEALNVDIFAATGHKSLFGPQGTGLLYVREGIEPLPFIDGGTGEDDELVEIPDRLESGTINTPGIGGLGAGIEFLLKEGVKKIRRYEEGLIRQILDGLSGIKGIEIIGPQDEKKRTHLVSFNMQGKDPSDIGYRLDNEFGIMLRCGLHCAPCAHRSAGTYPSGAVRVSPGYFNTADDIEEFLRGVREISCGF